jgi:hypothetical protein
MLNNLNFFTLPHMFALHTEDNESKVKYGFKINSRIQPYRIQKPLQKYGNGTSSVADPG